MENQSAYTLKEVQEMIYFSISVIDSAIRYTREKTPEKEKDLRKVYNTARKVLPWSIRRNLDHALENTMGGFDSKTRDLLHKLIINEKVQE